MLRCGAVLATLGSAAVAWGQPASVSAMNAVGRVATPTEVQAWNIDVRGDFKGLPKGAGSVNMGGKVWDGKCASCHGAFGESNSVFTPIVGGTSKKDIETGHVYFLSHSGYPHRTALPKSLTTDEVYGVLAYILNLGDIVPADFTLSDKNIAEVQNRLPNRNGKVFYKDMWEARGKGDVKNPLCMKGCPVAGRIESSLPDSARNADGNIAEQVRPFGPARGTDTSMAPRTLRVGMAMPATPTAPAAPAGASVAEAPAPASAAFGLVQANACTSCHGVTNKIVGPAFQDVARKYDGRADVVSYLTGKIRSGGQGVWGAIPMPEQAQLKDADARAIAQWLAAGAK